MARKSAPRSRRCVANECRKTCGLISRVMPAVDAIRFEDLPDADARERSAVAGIDEQPRRRAFARAAPASRHACSGEASRQPARPAARCVPCPLADAGEIALVEMQIARLDRHQLRHPHAARVEHFDQRLVAQAARRRDVGLREQPIDLVEVEKLRQRRPGARRLQVSGRALVELSLEREEPIEAADARHGPRHRTRRQSLSHQAP